MAEEKVKTSQDEDEGQAPEPQDNFIDGRVTSLNRIIPRNTLLSRNERKYETTVAALKRVNFLAKQTANREDIRFKNRIGLLSLREVLLDEIKFGYLEDSGK